MISDAGRPYENHEDEVWTTKEGQRVHVFQMTEEHAKNALRMILRKRREREYVDEGPDDGDNPGWGNNP